VALQNNGVIFMEICKKKIILPNMEMRSLLANALKAAGRVQKENFGKAVYSEQKESISSIVTEVDLLCDKIITDLIVREYPDHNLISEESGLKDNHSNYTWVIDPLDGTSNFAAGIPWFGVLIALFENDLPVLAGAYLPIDDLLYIAESGKGAFVNGEKLDMPNLLLKDSLVGFGIDYTDDAGFIDYGIELYRLLIKNARNIRCTNSLVDFMLVAEGKLGAQVNLFTKIWDIAAPWLIINEAGGALSHLFESELVFDLSENGLTTNYPVIAGSLPVLAEINNERRRIQ
jgi:myo-inositol-1(or 4)-monophosphatase